MRAHTLKLIEVIETVGAAGGPNIGLTSLRLSGGKEICTSEVVIRKEERLLYARHANTMAWSVIALEEVIAADFGVSDGSKTFPELLADMKRKSAAKE